MVALEPGLCAPSLWFPGTTPAPSCHSRLHFWSHSLQRPQTETGPGPSLSLIPKLAPGPEVVSLLLLLLTLRPVHVLPSPFRLDHHRAESLTALCSVLFLLSKCAFLPLLRWLQ